MGDVTPRAKALLAELELDERARSLPGELSRGMKPSPLDFVYMIAF